MEGKKVNSIRLKLNPIELSKGYSTSEYLARRPLVEGIIEINIIPFKQGIFAKRWRKEMRAKEVTSAVSESMSMVKKSITLAVRDLMYKEKNAPGEAATINLSSEPSLSIKADPNKYNSDIFSGLTEIMEQPTTITLEEWSAVIEKAVNYASKKALSLLIKDKESAVDIEFVTSMKSKIDIMTSDTVRNMKRFLKRIYEITN